VHRACAKHTAGEPDGLIALVALTGSLSTKFGVIISGIHRQSPYIKLNIVGILQGLPRALGRRAVF
jgi:hypothetical protein